MLEEFLHADGVAGSLEPWDWGYYAEKMRKARYDLDESQLKPYFEVWNTLENGVFYAMNRFYGVTFERRTDIPTYHPDMRVYTVLDKDGSELGAVLRRSLRAVEQAGRRVDGQLRRAVAPARPQAGGLQLAQRPASPPRASRR